MKELNGWWLPDDDNYFGAFTENGFQLDHLREAFKHVKQWRMAIDCGAHCGFWTKEMAGKFENVTTANVAVGSRPGSCRIMEDDKRIGNSGARYIKAGKDIRVISLDAIGF